MGKSRQNTGRAKRAVHRRDRVEERAGDWQRLAVCVAVAGSAILFWRPLADDFGVLKATVAGLAATAGAAFGVFRLLRSRVVLVPRRAVSLATVAFIALAVVATMTSPTPMLSAVGRHGRYIGLGLYAACALLFVATVSAFDRRRTRALLLSFLVASAVVSSYAVLQAVRLDPFAWGREYGAAATSTLGNPNFVSAFSAISIPLWIDAVHRGRRPDGVTSRAVGATGLLLAGAALVAARSLQGFLALAVALVVVAVVGLRERGDRARGAAKAMVVGAAVAGLLLVAGLAGLGPASPLGRSDTFAQRIGYWEAGLRTWQRDPLFGVGVDQYASYYRADRKVDDAIALGADNDVDQPHNVILWMLTSGGLVLAAAYGAFVLSVGLTLWKGLRSADGPEANTLACLGAAWVAYQAQSVVSIDVPPLAVAHWVLAAAIVVYTGQTSELRLPRRRPFASPVVLPALGAVSVLAAFVVMQPLRADGAAGRAAAGDSSSETRLDHHAEATKRAPWEPVYWQERANAAFGAGREPEARTLYEEAVERDGRGFVQLRSAARAARRAGDTAEATRYYRRLVKVEPHVPAVLTEAGAYIASVGLASEGERLIERATRNDMTAVASWSALAQVRAAMGNTRGARAAARRALELDNQDEVARRVLQEVETR